MTRPALPSNEAFRRWGVDPGWSRVIEVADRDGRRRMWHALDRSPAAVTPSTPTVVCVHGNPTWSYMWHEFHERLGDHFRVVAIDQLGMGYSERTPRRRFAQRVDDLGAVIDALDIDGPIVLAAHDWGGPIALGWAVHHADQVSGIVLCNTGVAVPQDRRAPRLIQVAAAGPITELACHRTPLFVEGTIRLSWPRLTRREREALRAPYRHRDSREAIRDFVDDVPFSPTDPSADSVAEVAEQVRSLSMPVLLAWGGRDPVFRDDFADDLASRLPHADRHRFGEAGHLVVLEADVVGLVDAWLDDRVSSSQRERSAPRAASSPSRAPGAAAGGEASSLWGALEVRQDDDAVAFFDGASGTVTSFAELHRAVMRTASGLAATGVHPGDRVAVLVPPSAELVATAYGCWRAGAVTVIADRGLGIRGLGAAVRAAQVQWVVGAPRALAAARALRWAPGARMVDVRCLTDGSSPAGESPLPPEPDADALAAVLYTSGATGPAKGVRYRQRQMAAQLGIVRSTYGITSADRLVAAFAPFALYGPALGIASAIPDVDVTKPGALTADALGAAIEAIDATIVFAAPAALANVNRTARADDERMSRVRLLLSAGAPVPVATLRSTARLCPRAELHTPYGMTECLPVADIELGEIEGAGVGGGVCVGQAVEGARILIAPLGFDAADPVCGVVGSQMGEVLVDAPWVSDGYDRLWRTEHDARPSDADGTTWHRTGDVGHVDDEGRLWIEGRSVHVIHSAEGPVTPVPIEVAVELLDDVDKAAAVGVGPLGCQQVVVVVEAHQHADGLAPLQLSAHVRAAVAHPVAAVLTVGALPVDIRHNTKIDRTVVARWAAAVLTGGRARRPW